MLPSFSSASFFACGGSAGLRLSARRIAGDASSDAVGCSLLLPHPANVFFYTNMLTLAHTLILAQDGDTVVIGDLEFDYSSDKSEAGMYDRWFKERKAAGIVGRGQARWPHATG